MRRAEVLGLPESAQGILWGATEIASLKSIIYRGSPDVGGDNTQADWKGLRRVHAVEVPNQAPSGHLSQEVTRQPFTETAAQIVASIRRLQQIPSKRRAAKTLTLASTIEREASICIS